MRAEATHMCTQTPPSSSCLSSTTQNQQEGGRGARLGPEQLLIVRLRENPHCWSGVFSSSRGRSFTSGVSCWWIDSVQMDSTDTCTNYPSVIHTFYSRLHKCSRTLFFHSSVGRSPPTDPSMEFVHLLYDIQVKHKVEKGAGSSTYTGPFPLHYLSWQEESSVWLV